MPVITISNQFGAGGPELGRELSKRLGIDYVDKEIIHKVALEVRVPQSHVEEYEVEHHDKFKSFFSNIFDIDALKQKAKVKESEEVAKGKYDDREKIPFQYHVDGWIDSDIYKKMITKVITALGDKGGVVISGRGGQHILKEKEDALHIRLVGEFDDRVKCMMEKKSMTQGDARDFVSTLDARSRDYLRFYFDCDPDLPTQYHLVLNTSRLSIAQCANIVEAALK